MSSGLIILIIVVALILIVGYVVAVILRKRSLTGCTGRKKRKVIQPSSQR